MLSCVVYFLMTELTDVYSVNDDHLLDENSARYLFIYTITSLFSYSLANGCLTALWVGGLRHRSSILTSRYGMKLKFGPEHLLKTDFNWSHHWTAHVIGV